MMDTDGSILLPLLFSKPGLATVPVLRLALMRKGGGSPHQSIRRPLEALDRSLLPADVSLLAQLLPRFADLDCYSAAYLFPPKDVDQFADQFPEGYSHLLAVQLGCYALGADATLGGAALRDALKGWTASTYPDKEGDLQSVTRLPEKLAAIFAENAELEEMGCPPVTDVLLADADRSAIAALLGRDAHELAGEMQLGEGDVAPDTVPQPQQGGPPPQEITLHFASSFKSALQVVFGVDLLAQYRRALRRRRFLRSKLLWLTAAAAVLVACLVYASSAGPPIGRVAIVDETGIQAFSEAGELLWVKDIGVPIAVAKLFSSEGSGQLVVVGLSRDLKGKGGGDILLFDRQGRQLWRFRMGHSTPYPELSSVHMGVKHVLVADILPHPGTEVVATVSCSWYPTRVCVLGEDGQLLREMWHPGVLNGVMRLDDSPRLVFWGCNNELGYQNEPDRPEKHYYASGIFCIEAEKIAGQCPPTAAPNLPLAPTLWYKILSPKGCTFETIRSKPVPDSPDPLIEVWTTTGWLLVLDVKGNIVSRSRSDSYEGPPCGLTDIHDVLGAKRDKR